jgi:hypothetical protein
VREAEVVLAPDVARRYTEDHAGQGSATATARPRTPGPGSFSTTFVARSCPHAGDSALTVHGRQAVASVARTELATRTSSGEAARPFAGRTRGEGDNGKSICLLSRGRPIARSNRLCGLKCDDPVAAIESCTTTDGPSQVKPAGVSNGAKRPARG